MEMSGEQVSAHSAGLANRGAYTAQRVSLKVSYFSKKVTETCVEKAAHSGEKESNASDSQASDTFLGNRIANQADANQAP